ncbi:MAG: hypothetical protein FVQ85_12405 [Planctomycetes bacterium]|nr:hypothetical protein [Planctomycetota bacterium]
MKKPIFFLISLFITIPCIADDCLSETAREYDIWVQWDRPCCWCCRYQCRGDINCASFLGKPITLSDLNIFKAAFNQHEEYFLINPGWICADLNHDGFLGKRVTLSDLNIFKQYFFFGSNIPQCDEPPIITGPYNWFCD